jgi:hypothetical protein
MRLIAQVVVEGEGQVLKLAAHIKSLIPAGIQFKLVNDLAGGKDRWDILFYGESHHWFTCQWWLRDMMLSSWNGVLAINMC